MMSENEIRKEIKNLREELKHSDDAIKVLTYKHDIEIYKKVLKGKTAR